jgi:hypothetical protein
VPLSNARESSPQGSPLQDRARQNVASPEPADMPEGAVPAKVLYPASLEDILNDPRSVNEMTAELEAARSGTRRTEPLSAHYGG